MDSSDANDFADQWEYDLMRGVKHFREEQGLSQGELAGLMAERGFKFHQATVYKIENGDRRITAAEAYGLAELFNVSVDELFRWERADDPAARQRRLWTTADRVTESILKLDTIARHLRSYHAAFLQRLNFEAAEGLRVRNLRGEEVEAKEFYEPLARFNLHNEILWRLRHEIWTEEFAEVFSDTSGVVGLGSEDYNEDSMPDAKYPRE